MNEPDQPTKDLFAKLNDIRSELSPESRKLLHTIINVAGQVKADADAITEPAAFEEEFDEAYTPYPQSTVDVIRAYHSAPLVPLEMPGSIHRVPTPVPIPGVFAIPPLVVHFGAHESDDNTDDD